MCKTGLINLLRRSAPRRVCLWHNSTNHQVKRLHAKPMPAAAAAAHDSAPLPGTASHLHPQYKPLPILSSVYRHSNRLPLAQLLLALECINHLLRTSKFRCTNIAGRISPLFSSITPDLSSSEVFVQICTESRSRTYVLLDSSFLLHPWFVELTVPFLEQDSRRIDRYTAS
jgi:hypothetical protein